MEADHPNFDQSPTKRTTPQSPEALARQNKISVQLELAMGELDEEQAQQKLEVLNGTRRED